SIVQFYRELFSNVFIDNNKNSLSLFEAIKRFPDELIGTHSIYFFDKKNKTKLKKINKYYYNLFYQLMIGMGYKVDIETNSNKIEIHTNYTPITLWHALSGSPTYQYKLGLYYYYGFIINQNINEALKWLKSASENNYSDAHLLLANIYINGEYVEENKILGLNHLQKSANLRNVYAANKLGEFYLDGNVIEKDYTKAFNLFIISARLENDHYFKEYLDK